MPPSKKGGIICISSLRRGINYSSSIPVAISQGITSREAISASKTGSLPSPASLVTIFRIFFTRSRMASLMTFLASTGSGLYLHPVSAGRSPVAISMISARATAISPCSSVAPAQVVPFLAGSAQYEFSILSRRFVAITTGSGFDDGF